MSGCRVAIAGCTGSIGTQTLDVLAAEPERFELTALGASGRRSRPLVEQARSTAVQGGGGRLRRAGGRARRPLPECEVRAGDGALASLATEADVVVNGVVGFAGLPVTLATLEAGRRLALANKESLIAAGPLVQRARRTPGAELVPGRQRARRHPPVPAGQRQPGSGRASSCSPPAAGPFRGRSRAELAAVTIDDALAHPTWSMGPKITVDSSTLMNKGLEVIEAHELFGAPAGDDGVGIGFDQIEVVVHPQSIVHSMVDLHRRRHHRPAVPARHAPAHRLRAGLPRPPHHPVRRASTGPTLGRLDFEPPDLDAFACLGLAYEAGRAGGHRPGLAQRGQRGGRGRLPRRAGSAGPRSPRCWPRRSSCHDGTPAADLPTVVDVDHRARAASRRAIERIAVVTDTIDPPPARPPTRDRRHPRATAGRAAARPRSTTTPRRRRPGWSRSPVRRPASLLVASSSAGRRLVGPGHRRRPARVDRPARVRPLPHGQAGRHEGHRVLRRLRPQAVVVHAGARPSTASSRCPLGALRPHHRHERPRGGRARGRGPHLPREELLGPPAGGAGRSVHATSPSAFVLLLVRLHRLRPGATTGWHISKVAGRPGSAAARRPPARAGRPAGERSTASQVAGWPTRSATAIQRHAGADGHPSSWQRDGQRDRSPRRVGSEPDATRATAKQRRRRLGDQVHEGRPRSSPRLERPTRRPRRRSSEHPPRSPAAPAPGADHGRSRRPPDGAYSRLGSATRAVRRRPGRAADLGHRPLGRPVGRHFLACDHAGQRADHRRSSTARSAGGASPGRDGHAAGATRPRATRRPTTG